jgi:hypothetical protein
MLRVDEASFQPRHHTTATHCCRAWTSVVMDLRSPRLSRFIQHIHLHCTHPWCPLCSQTCASAATYQPRHKNGILSGCRIRVEARTARKGRYHECLFSSRKFCCSPSGLALVVHLHALEACTLRLANRVQELSLL